MRKKAVVLVLGLVVIVAGWWVISSRSHAQTSEGVIDVWSTWSDGPAQLQELLDGYAQTGGVQVRVATRVRGDDLMEALAGTEPPDLVILSGVDLVEAAYRQGLAEPLDDWIEGSGIHLDDIYPAPLAQCEGVDGAILCLPWGSDADALFWNKDLFEAAGLDPERPPQTMEELVEFASKLTIRDGKGELSQVGFIPALPRSHTELYARMFGGEFFRDRGTELIANSPAVTGALDWQRRFYGAGAAEKVQDFVASFTPYMTSRHPLYAGRRLSCQQCHRSSPIHNSKTPDTGFADGKIAMMIDGQWQVGRSALSAGESQVNYGVAPVPPPAAHPERAGTSIVRGPVIILPAGAMDKEAAVQLLAWMMSPEIVAEAALANSLLPTSRTAAQDPRFRQDPGIQVFLDLLANPNAQPAVTTLISAELNEALDEIEAEVLYKGGDPLSLLNQVQAALTAKLEEALAGGGSP